MSEEIKNAFVEGFKGSWEVFFALLAVIFATIVAYSDRGHVVIEQKRDAAPEPKDAV